LLAATQTRSELGGLLAEKGLTGSRRTWMVHVSSELNSTMGSPPLASSILFCGRNRATTGIPHSQYFVFRQSASRLAVYAPFMELDLYYESG